MANFDFEFDPAAEEGSSFDLIPAGDYPAEIVDAAIRPPNNGDGLMLALVWALNQGPYEGRKIFQNLCFKHSKQQTQDIARKQIKDICDALGIVEIVTDPEVFKFKPAKVRVVIESDKTGRYDDSNRIKRVTRLEDGDGEAAEAKASVTSKPPAPSVSAEPAAKPETKPTGNGPGAAPWKRSA